MPRSYGLIDPVELPLPALPHALEGLRIAQVSDLHVTRPRRRYQQVIDQLGPLRIDLLLLTGDYMSRWGNEAVAARLVKHLIDRLEPRFGCFGVFGNHDSPALKHQLADLPVSWLHNQVRQHKNLPIELLGLGMLEYENPDGIATALDWPEATEGETPPQEERPLRLALAHCPDDLMLAADLGADLVLSGHTHGGQCRLPGGQALFNSSSLPLNLTAGLLRHRETLAVISRGLGEVLLPLRVCCKPHVPLYTLRRRPLPAPRTEHLRAIRRW